MNTGRLIVIAFHLAFNAVALIAPSNELMAQTTETGDRPKIGLALSGGGTKAGAHIGVLRMLDEYQVPVDYIAGTSAGAIIGSLYAAGLTPDEIEAAVASIDWNDLLEDSPARDSFPFKRKRDSYNYLVKFRPGYNKGAITLPMGLVQGQRVVQFFRRQFETVADIRDFDDLPIPLRVIATDLESGEAVVLGQGDMALAVRASMSIPVFFAPVEVAGRRLNDGGPANNLPVDVVRQMGADIVIAVDITAPLLRGEELDSAVTVADQMTNMLTLRTVREQVDQLTERDILIRPQFNGLGGMDFARTLESIEPGRLATAAFATELAELALSDGDYQQHMNGRISPAPAAAEIIRFVDITNTSRISTVVIKGRLGIEVGDAVDIAVIEQGIANVYGLDIFEQVDYRIERGPEGVGLIINVTPKPWGPNYLQFGLALRQDFSAGSNFDFGVAYLRTAVNDLGGEWRVQLDVGERQGLRFDWYQPIHPKSRHFVEMEALGARRNFQFFEQGDAVAELRVTGWGSRLSAGTEFGNSGEFRFGWNRFSGEADLRIGTLDLPDDSVNIGEFFSTIRHDSLDNLNFPQRGLAAALGGFWSRRSAGSDTDFEQFSAAGYAARSWGNNTILASLEGGTTRNDAAPLESQYLLGGLGRLSGYPVNRFAGQHYALGSVTAFRRINRSLWLPMYDGLSIEAGNVWQDSDSVDSSDLLTSGTIYLGADTMLGPLYLAWGFAEGGENTLYLNLGNPFVSGGARPLDLR